MKLHKHNMFFNVNTGKITEEFNLKGLSIWIDHELLFFSIDDIFTFSLTIDDGTLTKFCEAFENYKIQASYVHTINDHTKVWIHNHEGKMLNVEILNNESWIEIKFVETYITDMIKFIRRNINERILK